MARLCPTCGLKLPADASFCPEDGSRLVADPLVGKVVGGHTLLELLGEDPLGPVYRGEHVELGREVAVKILRGTDRALTRRYQAQAQALARLNDPHMVRVFESGSTDAGEVFVTMELLRGRRLDRTLSAEGAMGPRRAARVADQVAHALEAAHAERLLHLDLCPRNVLLETDEEGGDFVRVLDFGMSALGGRPRDADANHLAPEQLDDRKDLDARADLFSLGVLLYELLTGSSPFADLDPRRQSPPPPHHPDWEIPGPLAALTSRLLARDRAHRPQSAKAVRAALAETGLLRADDARQLATQKRYIETARIELAQAWAELEAERSRVVRIEAPDWAEPTPAPVQRPQLPELPETPAPTPAPLVVEPWITPLVAYALGLATGLLAMGVLFASGVVDISF